MNVEAVAKFMSHGVQCTVYIVYRSPFLDNCCVLCYTSLAIRLASKVQWDGMFH